MVEDVKAKEIFQALVWTVGWLLVFLAVGALVITLHSAIAPGGKFTRLVVNVTNIWDSMESYAQGVDLNAKNGGTGWRTEWMSAQNILGIQAGDDLQTVFYTSGSVVNGLDRGFGWGTTFTDMDNLLFGFFGADSFETYSDGAAVDGLNGNTALANGRVMNWATAWSAN